LSLLRPSARTKVCTRMEEATSHWQAGAQKSAHGARELVRSPIYPDRALEGATTHLGVYFWFSYIIVFLPFAASESISASGSSQVRILTAGMARMRVRMTKMPSGIRPMYQYWKSSS